MSNNQHNMCIGLLALFAACGDVASAVDSPVVWIPDFIGQDVEVRIGEDPSTKSVKLSLTGCNPNSVAVDGDNLFVACNKDGGNRDQILVFDAGAIREANAGAALAALPAQTIVSAEFDGLTGIAFDAQHNLWVASFDNNKLLRFSRASLASSSPVVDHILINTPDQPVGLTFDPDGSLWVAGQFSNGIVLNIPADQLTASSPVPRFCISNNAVGCQQQPNLFNGVEGVALFNGTLWVANNGNVAPGRELVRLRVAGGALVVDSVFGDRSQMTGPFLCPGGLFATRSNLWVNDQGFGKQDTTCGATDPGTAIGAVLRFTQALLDSQSSDSSQIVRFPNITSRSGFGGIYVED